MDAGYGISRRLPGSFPFGDDGGGMVLLYFDGASGWGVYRSGLGELEPAAARWVAASLAALLAQGVGMELL